LHGLVDKCVKLFRRGKGFRQWNSHALARFKRWRLLWKAVNGKLTSAARMA
jgi:hypothetical protein